MEATDWDFVLQFVSDPLTVDFAQPDMAASEQAGPSTLGRADPTTLAIPSSQIPTPPASSEGSPADDSAEGDTLVSVSTTFFPGASIYPSPPDLIVLSCDSVFFYVHIDILSGASENEFNGMLPVSPSKEKDQVGPVLSVPECSTVLNIVLHAMYDMSCAHYSPSFEDLRSAVHALETYGVPPKSRIAPSLPLFTVLMSHAPLCPIELYALAASYDLYEIAVTTSSHLLSFSLAAVTDELAERIGPLYLKRLFFLHFGRADALKRLLLPPPHPHAPTPLCDFAEQKRLTRAWALASAYLAWDARPDLSTSTMESALSPLAEHLSCELCRSSLKDRIKNLIVQWSVVKRTI